MTKLIYFYENFLRFIPRNMNAGGKIEGLIFGTLQCWQVGECVNDTIYGSTLFKSIFFVLVIQLWELNK